MKAWVPPFPLLLGEPQLASGSPPPQEEPQLASGWFALEKRLSCFCVNKSVIGQKQTDTSVGQKQCPFALIHGQQKVSFRDKAFKFSR